MLARVRYGNNVTPQQNIYYVTYKHRAQKVKSTCARLRTKPYHALHELQCMRNATIAFPLKVSRTYCAYRRNLAVRHYVVFKNVRS